jgi:hypothetical protein
MHTMRLAMRMHDGRGGGILDMCCTPTDRHACMPMHAPSICTGGIHPAAVYNVCISLPSLPPPHSGAARVWRWIEHVLAWRGHVWRHP